MVKIEIIEGGFSNIMNLFIFFLIIFVLFIPIPLKIYISYKNNMFIVKFYRFTLYPLKYKKTVCKSYSKVKEKDKFTHKLKNSFNKDTLQKILYILCKNKFKPGLKLNLNIDYGFEDAALTGLSYGLLNTIFAPLQHIMNLIFKVKKLELNALPDFNGSKLNLEIKSIILISIAQIINICIKIGFTLYKSYKENKCIHRTKGKFKEA